MPSARSSRPSAAPAASADATARAAHCLHAPIYRDRALGERVKLRSEACRATLARHVEGRPGDARCTSDAECTIVAVAGGCMGVAMSRVVAAGVQPLDRSCAPNTTCWDADFTDHRIRCLEGCCTIYEE